MRWNPPKECPALKIFLIEIEGDIFSVLPGNSSFYNLTKDEWLAMRGLADDRSIVIKLTNKGSYEIVWDRADYLGKLKTISL